MRDCTFSPDISRLQVTETPHVSFYRSSSKKYPFAKSSANTKHKWKKYESTTTPIKSNAFPTKRKSSAKKKMRSSNHVVNNVLPKWFSQDPRTSATARPQP